MKSKTRFYKSIAWVLTLALMMTFIPGFTLGVSAADDNEDSPYNLYVGGVAVTDTNKDDITTAINEKFGENKASGSAIYDSVNGTLKLHDFVVTWEGDTTIGADAIYYRGNDTLKLELSGSSFVTAENTVGANNCYAVISRKNIEISGEGSLTATAQGAPDFCSGVVAFGTITMISGHVQGESGSSNVSVGVWAEGDITVSGGSLVGIGGEAKAKEGQNQQDAVSCGIYTYEDIISENGNVIGKGGISGRSYGLLIHQNTVIKGGTLEAVASAIEIDSPWACGLCTSGSITISGGVLNFTGGTYGDGVYAAGDINIDGGEFNIKAEDDGMYSRGNISITDGKFNIEAEGDGVYATSNISITDGEFNIKAQYDGVSTGGNINIDGGEFNIEAERDGVFAGGNISITDGEFNIKTKYAGMDINGNVTISGGIIGIESEDNGLEIAGDFDISDGKITINACGDGIYGNGDVLIQGGTLDITAVLSGLESDGDTAITGGAVTFKANAEEESACPALRVFGKLTIGSGVKIKGLQEGKITEITEGEETPDETSDDYTYNTIVDANGNFVTDVELIYCSDGDSEATTYTVSFNANGGAAIENSVVNYGEKYGSLPSSEITGLSGGDNNWYLVDENGNVTDIEITQDSIVETLGDHTLFVKRKVLTPTIKITLEVPDAISDGSQYYVPDNSKRILTVTVENQNTEILDYTYQWYKDGAEIEGETDAKLTLDGSVADAGTYKVKVTATLKEESDIVVTDNRAAAEKEQVVEIMYATETDTEENDNKPADSVQSETDNGKEDNTTVDTTSPQTGDNSNSWLWIALLFVSGGAMIILIVADRKRRSAAKR